jgi:hypothetical protein
VHVERETLCRQTLHHELELHSCGACRHRGVDLGFDSILSMIQ